MGLLDNLGGMLGGAGEGQQTGGPGAPGALGAIGGLLQGHEGGLPGLLQAFQQAGLGGVAQSWVSNEANQMITPDQIQRVMGDGPIAQFAEKLGVTPEMASQHIAELLPQVVNHLTPNGTVPDQGTDALSSLLNTFKH